jgi:hypothetical protein
MQGHAAPPNLIRLNAESSRPCTVSKRSLGVAENEVPGSFRGCFRKRLTSTLVRRCKVFLLFFF